jgi:hypothetical protein
MKKMYYLFFVTILSLCCHSAAQNANAPSLLRLVMDLSAFGVESDHFPAIAGVIDFVKKDSKCNKSYDNPAIQGSTYSLTTLEIDSVIALLSKIDLESFKKDYKTKKTDQPTSTMTIYTNQKLYTIQDYGLKGDSTLINVYNIIYKL